MDKLDYPYMGNAIAYLILFIMIITSDLNNIQSALITPVHSS